MKEHDNYQLFEESVMSISQMCGAYGIEVSAQKSDTYFGGKGQEFAFVTPAGEYFYIVYLSESDLASDDLDFNQGDADVVLFSMPIIALIADYPDGPDPQAFGAFEQFVHQKSSQIGRDIAQLGLGDVYTCVHEIEGGLAVHLDGDWTGVRDFEEITQTVSLAIASFETIKDSTNQALSDHEG